MTEAARELAMSLRQLHRLAAAELGCTPGILLGLARIASVAREVERERRSFARIARAHGFPDRVAMHHQFVRFVGMSPGDYRSRAAACVTRPISDWQNSATDIH